VNAVTTRLKSKTYWAAIIMSVLTIIDAQQGSITALVPDEYRPYLPLVFPLAMLFFRELTTTALAEK